ncbi:hypothetical protein CF319_g7595 [Tilletia indica]|uniref:Uncharacterized protein n=1 Tax=Tilletia indica TaxID=43049 RepID=A0A177TMK7_9BASI|nr:hypothetical protein CF319_g7595 [Tilletia indica]KAE8245095.1 hypothetical protein A4X13_0g6090 [Tilletia indica]
MLASLGLRKWSFTDIPFRAQVERFGKFILSPQVTRPPVDLQPFDRYELTPEEQIHLGPQIKRINGYLNELEALKKEQSELTFKMVMVCESPLVPMHDIVVEQIRYHRATGLWLPTLDLRLGSKTQYEQVLNEQYKTITISDVFEDETSSNHNRFPSTLDFPRLRKVSQDSVAASDSTAVDDIDGAVQKTIDDAIKMAIAGVTECAVPVHVETTDAGPIIAGVDADAGPTAAVDVVAATKEPQVETANAVPAHVEHFIDEPLVDAIATNVTTVATITSTAVDATVAAAIFEESAAYPVLDVGTAEVDLVTVTFKEKPQPEELRFVETPNTVYDEPASESLDGSPSFPVESGSSINAAVHADQEYVHTAVVPFDDPVFEFVNISNNHRDASLDFKEALEAIAASTEPEDAGDESFILPMGEDARPLITSVMKDSRPVSTYTSTFIRLLNMGKTRMEIDDALDQAEKDMKKHKEVVVENHVDAIIVTGKSDKCISRDVLGEMSVHEVTDNINTPYLIESSLFTILESSKSNDSIVADNTKPTLRRKPAAGRGLSRIPTRSTLRASFRSDEEDTTAATATAPVLEAERMLRRTSKAGRRMSRIPTRSSLRSSFKAGHDESGSTI